MSKAMSVKYPLCSYSISYTEVLWQGRDEGKNARPPLVPQVRERGLSLRSADYMGIGKKGGTLVSMAESEIEWCLVPHI